MAEPTVKVAKMGEFRPLKTNPNKHTERGLGMLDRSMSEVGYVAPMTAAADGEILDGSARLETAAQRFGDEVLVIHHDGKTPIVCIRDDIPNANTPEAKRIAIASNRIAEIDLSWSAEQLFADIEAGVNLDGLFAENELADILGDLLKPAADAEPQIDKAEELRVKWGVETGQLWALGDHRLICGDCTDKAVVEWLMGGERAALCLTDPPYGVSIVKGLRAAVGGSKPVTIGSIRPLRKDTFGGVKNMSGTDGARHMVDATLYHPVIGDDKPFEPVHLFDLADNLIIFGGNYFASKLPDSRCWIVWDKNNTGNFADAELAWTSFDRSVKLYKFTWNGLLREGSRAIEGKNRMHPTQKLVGLFGQILSDFSSEGDIIIDPYCGVGTTIIACEQLKRKARAVEIDPGYTAVCLERFHQLTGGTPERIS
jgi:hypothetical protein